MVKGEVIDILRKYIFLLRTEGIPVKKAFLYGSYMSGTATPESDIDVLIVTENENDDLITGKAWSLTKKINSRIEPFLIDTKRFYSPEDSPLIDLVKSTGVEIL